MPAIAALMLMISGGCTAPALERLEQPLLPSARMGPVAVADQAHFVEELVEPGYLDGADGGLGMIVGSVWLIGAETEREQQRQAFKALLAAADVDLPQAVGESLARTVTQYNLVGRLDGPQPRYELRVVLDILGLELGRLYLVARLRVVDLHGPGEQSVVAQYRGDIRHDLEDWPGHLEALRAELRRGAEHLGHRLAAQMPYLAIPEEGGEVPWFAQ